MKLYIVTIRGHKFYFTGKLTDDVIKAAESLCIQLGYNGNNFDPQKLFGRLLNHLESACECQVTPVNVEHIFRINS